MATLSSTRLKSAGSVERNQTWRFVPILLVIAIGLGFEIARLPMLALAVCGMACVVLATPFVETLGVLTFWLLPYLILNLPTGGITLKVPEVTAYLFASAAMIRALLRRDPITMPPATLPVLIYLCILTISAMLAPPVPAFFGTQWTGLQGPDLRPFSIIFWLGLSWLVVVGLYHVVGTSPTLYRRCVRGHILGGALASVISIAGYLMALRGDAQAMQAIGHSHAFVFTGGSFYRLTGVSYEPLVFAFYLMTVIPASFAVILYHPDWVPRPVAVFSFLVQALALLLTFSAGGFVSLVVGAVLLAYFFRPKKYDLKKMWLPLIGGALVLGAIPILVCLNPILNRTALNALSKLTSGGYKQRNDEIITGMRMFHDYFWLGTGPSLTPFYFPIYHPVVHSMNTMYSAYIANLYVTTLAESGIIGLISLAFCAIFGLSALLRPILFQGPVRVPVLTALTVSLIGCAIQYWEAINLFLIYFPVLIGLAVSGARLARTQAEVSS